MVIPDLTSTFKSAVDIVVRFLSLSFQFGDVQIVAWQIFVFAFLIVVVWFVVEHLIDE